MYIQLQKTPTLLQNVSMRFVSDLSSLPGNARVFIKSKLFFLLVGFERFQVWGSSFFSKF